MYPTLYTARQAAAEYLPRQWYYDDALALPWVREITIRASSAVDPNALRGMVVAHDRQSHGGMQSFKYTIILAEGMDPEYERFVTIKELMHCYFAPVEKNVRYVTGSEIALENHMQAFFGASTNNAAQALAERLALWMAIGVLCTEHDRKTMIEGIKSNTLVSADIASKMRIPAPQAKALISAQYTTEIARLL